MSDVNFFCCLKCHEKWRHWHPDWQYMGEWEKCPTCGFKDLNNLEYHIDIAGCLFIYDDEEEEIDGFELALYRDNTHHYSICMECKDLSLRHVTDSSGCQKCDRSDLHKLGLWTSVPPGCLMVDPIDEEEL